VKAPRQPDVDLVRRAQRGDRAAFAELFELLHRPVLGYVYHLVGDAATAEDVAQDAFVRAHERIGQLGPPYDFKSWVYRIAGNLAMDHLRGARRIVDLEEPLPMDEPPTTRRPLERKVQREEARRSVRETLADLPASYRQALVLRELNGLSYDEVARALECTYENARQLVHRARLRFRELHGLRAIAAAAPQCRELGDLLSAYRDGELRAGDRRAVRAHLASCLECRETERDLKKLGALLAALPPILPTPAWKSSVLGRIGAPPPPPPPPGVLAALGGWAPLAIGVPAVAILAAVIVVLRANFPGPPPISLSPTASVTLAEASATPAATAPAPSQTPMASATEGPSPSPEPSSTLGPPFVTARQASNCRSGPGTIYVATFYLEAGDTGPIDGRNAATTWWRIEAMDGALHCWVWDQNVLVGGDTSMVPILPDPPTPTPVDDVAPVVSASHSPANPTDLDPVTFVASAGDNVGVVRIEIWLQAPGETAPSLAHTCFSAGPCTFVRQRLPAGQARYFARAWDEAGNRGETSTITFTVRQGLL
jgi:RNA polymerase sigma-70 factor (ECF subfamily)